MNRIFRHISVFMLLCFYLSGVQCKLEEFYQWKQIEFDGIPLDLGSVDNDLFAGDSDFNKYNAYSNLPMGVEHYKGRLFITIPRRRFGIPSSLNYIDMNSVPVSDKSPKLKPYPDYDTNELQSNLQPNPDRIISVYRTRVDSCNRLWFVDTGVLELPDNRTQIQRPSIWVIDLKTNRQIRRFEIPESVAEFGQGLASITIDCSSRKCGDAFAYVPDLGNRRLSVYSFRQNKLWSFNHNYFSFDPIHGDFNIGGVEFRWDDGIFSVTLGPIQRDGFRTAFFFSLASTRQFMVNTKILRNETLSTRSSHDKDFVHLGSRGKNKQAIIHAFDIKTRIIVYAEVGRNAFGCWNTRLPFSEQNFDTIDHNDITMFYPGDISVDENGMIWAITNSMPRFLYSNLNPNEVNYRIWRNPIREAIRNTRCEFGSRTHRFGNDDVDFDEYEDETEPFTVTF